MAPLASVLSERQKEELHRALLDYLSSAGLHSTFEALKSELPAQQDFQPDPKAKWAGLLEKKWTSVIRLQKKIMDLERENSMLKDELASAGSITSSRKGQQDDWLPGRGGGARHTLVNRSSLSNYRPCLPPHFLKSRLRQ